MEAGAFPSDQYAVESQLRFHGLDPDTHIIEIKPREGEITLRNQDIIDKINLHAEELSLIMFGGINYYTGQFFDLEAICKAGHAAGTYVGFDLAHASGNVPLELHKWGADFAVWCSYKYMNGGPGGISGAFIHQKHFNSDLNRFTGWWGYDESTRFKMAKGFNPQHGAAGWQISCSPVLLMAAFKASLIMFKDAGGIPVLRNKSVQLTEYLEFIINDINKNLGYKQFRIITPSEPEARGCQLSILAAKKGKYIFDRLEKEKIIGDWREPDVIRISPAPLYNTFAEVFLFGDALKTICRDI